MSETAILFFEFIFSPSYYEVLFSTEDAASGIFLQILRKRVRERERKGYRVLVKL